MSTKRKPTQRTQWQPLQPAELGDPARWADAGIGPPDRVYVNNIYSVYVRDIGHGALHISFHRHSRGAVRDWRHFQAIKNEVAGPERLAVEVFPPESRLIDEANEYHLWVVPEGCENDFPFLVPTRQVGTQEDMERELGHTRARQRDWQPAASQQEKAPESVPTRLEKKVMDNEEIYLAVEDFSDWAASHESPLSVSMAEHYLSTLGGELSERARQAIREYALLRSVRIGQMSNDDIRTSIGEANLPWLVELELHELMPELAETTITVTLGEVIDNDFESFQALVAERAFGDADIRNIDYAIVGYTASTLDLHVSAEGGGE